MPITFWIVGAVALFALLLLAAIVWFDRLFEEPTAQRISSLVQHHDARSVLAVFAHADDETLAASALADAAGRDGVWVKSITLTRGEGGYPQPHICSEADLPLVRESELRRFGFGLGIDHQEVWTFPDGGLENTPRDEIVDQIVRRIREWKPDLAITFDPACGYNDHPDHRVCGRITTDAVRTAGDSTYKPEELGSPHRVKKLAYILAPSRAFGFFAPDPVREAIARQPAPNFAVPIRRGLPGQGWRIHESQHLDRAFPFPAWLLDDFWDQEHYLVLDP